MSTVKLVHCLWQWLRALCHRLGQFDTLIDPADCVWPTLRDYPYRQR